MPLDILDRLVSMTDEEFETYLGGNSSTDPESTEDTLTELEPELTEVVEQLSEVGYTGDSSATADTAKTEKKGKGKPPAKPGAKAKAKKGTKKTPPDKDKPSSDGTGTFSDKPARLVVIQLSESFDVDLYENDADEELTEVEEDGKLYLKVPIAVLGSWEHPEYGHIEFAQADFDDIQRNFAANVNGYEPPLFLGHPNNFITTEGAPAVAFLSELEQEGDVLYGYWEVVDEEVYNDVKAGKYRYSSAELIRPAKSKETGDDIGTLLVGTAITNRPFLTRLPRISALSDSETKELYNDCTEYHTSFLFPLESNSELCVNDAMTTNANAKTEASEPTQVQEVALSEAPAQTENFSERFLSLAQRVEAAEAKANKAEAELAKRLLSEKISHIKSLNLSQATRDWATELIQNQALDEANESKFIDGLEKLSEENNALLLEQKGSSEETDKVNNPENYSINPFESIIQQNQKLADELKTRRQAIISVY